MTQICATKGGQGSKRMIALRDGEVTLLAWCDYVGIMRCRGVPAAALPDQLAHGLGWAAAGQALTPFEDIADNPWGPLTEFRQTPVPATHTRLDIWPDTQPFNIVLCDSMSDGHHWECCTRGFYKVALADLEAETGLTMAAAFEHEFLLTGEAMSWTVPFSVEQMRKPVRFLSDLTHALTLAMIGLETVEPEFGINQYEISTAPAIGVAAGDRAIITREVIRECARRLGCRAGFSPKPTPKSVGNGAHVHFSLVDAHGTNRTYDASGGKSQLSVIARQFAAGVVHHMPALCALVAPSPVSYLRLGPHHWSCGYASFGVQNREAAIRVCPSPDPQKRAQGHNLEFRPPDATANPYLVLGALVRAGLSGIRQGLPLPQPLGCDPATLSDTDRAAMGIRPLPATLGAALDALLADEIASSWMPAIMRDSYVTVKRKEIAMFAEASPEALCQRYNDAY